MKCPYCDKTMKVGQPRRVKYFNLDSNSRKLSCAPCNYQTTTREMLSVDMEILFHDSKNLAQLRELLVLSADGQ